MSKQTILILIFTFILSFIPTFLYGKKKNNKTTTKTEQVIKKTKLKGEATYYGSHYTSRRKTASGEYFNQHSMTAAHKTLPFGTMVRVTNTKNKKSVVVKINDRGPFAKGRIIDLSVGAAKKLDMIKSGVAPVVIEIL